jgi:hypothetical protein
MKKDKQSIACLLGGTAGGIGDILDADLGVGSRFIRR